jgi:hypothetical protein
MIDKRQTSGLSKPAINSHLLLALALALVYHGGLLFFTFKRTYDAYVHIFFADHYVRAWFDHWEYRWYTGFTMTSYPPGSQQAVGLLSNLIGLQNGFIVVQTFAVLMVVLGIYRFSRIWVSEEAAGYAALLAVFSSSITETIHVFGQLPTTFSLGFLLNALPFVYRYLDEGDFKYLLIAWSLNAATTAGHHVTTLFGAVFFVAPVMVLAIVQHLRKPLPDEAMERPAKVTRGNLRPLVVRRLRRILPVVLRCAVYGVGLILILVLVVLPYWLWSRSDPITQVSIPHASRDSFIQNTAAGLVFWVIPYGVALIALPYVFYKGLSTKAWPLAMSLGLLFFLGTGGTTPFPRLLLRGAYDILTLDRFTFWATILLLPLLGEFVASLRHGRLACYIREQFGQFMLRLVQVSLLLGYLLFSVFTANLTQFRKFQPEPINMQPIVNFLEKDEHWRWRFLTLGFGDQLAWLSAQTTATTPDGNYHSARRLPELTTTPVERLEGAKFRGIPGIGSLQQFLTVPEKYNLKFVFSNDQFYDPLLFFSGWHRLQRLENGIMVWEREDIPPLPEVLPRKEIPIYQRLMWGIIPMTAVALALIASSLFLWGSYVRRLLVLMGILPLLRRVPIPGRGLAHQAWQGLDQRLLAWSQLPAGDDSPVQRWQIWLDWVRQLPRPQPAPPSARLVRTLVLLGIAMIVLVGTGIWISRQVRDPLAVVEAYYDDLDFRRFESAYARLDPQTRPSLDQYLLQLSVQNGLLASYGKLDTIKTRLLKQETERLVVAADTVFVTPLAEYPTTQQHVLVKRDGRWYLQPEPVDITVPPDQFFRRGTVAWKSQGRRRVTTETTAFADVLDRPELQILSARLVRWQTDTCPERSAETSEEAEDAADSATCYRYSVVGELMNTDVDPGDVTVTAQLFDQEGNELTWYNAQSVLLHKLLPKEVTPFRVDFEGVAGAALREEAVTEGDFRPDAFTPVELANPVAAFEVYAKAVVTDKDLDRDVAGQGLQVVAEDGQEPRLMGQLINNGTREATVPHVLVTYYDSDNSVAWVDHHFPDMAIRPQRVVSFDLPITLPQNLELMLEKGDVYANILEAEVRPESMWQELIPLPPELGYDSLRVSVNYFVGSEG